MQWARLSCPGSLRMHDAAAPGISARVPSDAMHAACTQLARAIVGSGVTEPWPSGGGGSS
jgi:hypothetical protein